MFPKEIFITPLRQLIKALDVAKKGRPKNDMDLYIGI